MRRMPSTGVSKPTQAERSDFLAAASIGAGDSGRAGAALRKEALYAGTKLKRTVLQLAPPTGPREHRFKILQWNVLADGLAQHGDFVKVPPEVLEWDYRMPLMLAEVAESEADIICIQELNHFKQLHHQLEPLGYLGTFLAKQCSPANKYKCPADGLAIFYNTKRFEAVGSPAGHIYLDKEGQRQSQGFLQVHLRDLASGQELLVVTTHLKSKEGIKEEQVRTRQIRQLLHSIKPELLGEPATVATAATVPALAGPNAVESLATDCDNGACCTGNDSTGGADGCGDGEACVASSPGSPAPVQPEAFRSDPSTSSSNGGVNGNGLPPAALPVIIAGDFNATPDSVPCKEMKAHPAGLESIWDVKPLSSVIVRDGSDAGEREFSTWKFRSAGESKRIIDHMWFTRGRKLRPTSRWRMLTEKEIGPTALPCVAYASDHLALCVEFEWS